MKEWDDILRDISDDPSEFDRDGGTVILRRHGVEYAVELRTLPGVGCVATQATGEREPVEIFVQRTLLRLDHLAGQMLKTFERLAKKRPVPFVDGPAELSVPGRPVQRSERAAQSLAELLSTPEYGTTHVVQLMANAGQGKTVLLEQVATDAALKYQPHQHPNPLVLPVDLLGRYVGNIDDAIAGSLNNTFSSPGLRQADVLVCLKKSWMILALDGFDELVARVGVANAFSHITELVDQLNGFGTVVLSARQSFFELYEISSGIRRFLVPKRGTYTSSVVKLAPWTEAQGTEVFRVSGSTTPEKDFRALLQLFQGDKNVIFHPFFLTRLAILWRGGERFAGLPGQSDVLSRAKWVIETFIARENSDKWTSTSGVPLLAGEQHAHLLGGVAEEMWMTGAFRLRADELRLAAEIGIMDLGLEREVIDQIKERVPTHAAFIESGGYVSFFHDQFLSYALGHRIAMYFQRGRHESLTRLLVPRTLPPDTLAWATWFFMQSASNAEMAAAFCNEVASSGFASMAQAENCGLLISSFLSGTSVSQMLKGQRFYGEALRRRVYTGVTFTSCSMWEVDLRESQFRQCRFVDCEFGNVLVNAETAFSGSEFISCKFTGIQLDEGGAAFSPQEIDRLLTQKGGKVASEGATLPPARRASEHAIRCVEEVIRRSERTCDVAVEDVEETYPDIAKKVMKLAERHGVMKRSQRETSGPKRTFYRFQVDRNQLLRGQGATIGDQGVTEFWTELSDRFPASAAEPGVAADGAPRRR